MENLVTLTIKANDGITNVEFEKNSYDNKVIDSVVITFKKSTIWSDLEFWLNSQNDEFLDYMKMYITKRNKMKIYKS